MKQLLIIDESPLLREYLQQKLSLEGIRVAYTNGGIEGLFKMRQEPPDAVIIDYDLTKKSCIAVLEEKKQDPAIAGIPVIVMARNLTQKQTIDLLRYQVKKVFAKPLRVDTLFLTLGELFGLRFELDQTPCILDVHMNEEILFVEVAQGLNREKMEILRYKIAELLDLYRVKEPKLIVMMTGLTLGFADATNLELLFRNLLEASKAKTRNIRILTNDPFTTHYLNEKKEFASLPVAKSLQTALDGLLHGIDSSDGLDDREAALIGERVLTATNTERDPTMELRFAADAKGAKDSMPLSVPGQPLRIAVVDDDFVIQQLIKTSFKDVNAEVLAYSDGDEFLASVSTQTYDLVFLDLMMPRVDGFTVLTRLKALDIKLSIIVLSAVNTRQAVVAAFEKGVKSYVVKPLTPADVLTKAREILRTTF